MYGCSEGRWGASVVRSSSSGKRQKLFILRGIANFSHNMLSVQYNHIKWRRAIGTMAGRRLMSTILINISDILNILNKCCYRPREYMSHRVTQNVTQGSNECDEHVSEAVLAL